MIVRIRRRNVDVLDRDCAQRSCFRLGFDQGPYSQGRGYTNAPKNPRAVCGRRHNHGCPTVSVCPVCRTGTPDAPGAPCQRRTSEEVVGADRLRFEKVQCAGVTVELEHLVSVHSEERL